MRKKKRVFQQERAERTYKSILAAAAKLFPKKGFDGTQIPDIAHAADVSVGIVYRYFEDKREIFLEMLEAHLDAARAEVSMRLAPDSFVGANPAASITRVLDVVFDEVEKDPAIARVYLAMSLTDKDVAKMRHEAESYDREMLASILKLSVPHLRDPHAAALVIERAVQGVAIDCVLGSRTVAIDAAKAALKLMIVSWLFVETA
ncbi:MAG: TetR family transcriptional regulator [Polyangiaceae bacterium]